MAGTSSESQTEDTRHVEGYKVSLYGPGTGLLKGMYAIQIKRGPKTFWVERYHWEKLRDAYGQIWVTTSPGGALYLDDAKKARSFVEELQNMGDPEILTSLRQVSGTP